jgi:hypothetical protein
MSMLPGLGSLLTPGTVSEAMALGRRAVAALERQAELMADPEPATVVDKDVDNTTPGTYIRKEVAQEEYAKANGAGYRQAKEFFGQKLQDILDGGYVQHERAEKLRALCETMNGSKKPQKK